MTNFGSLQNCSIEELTGHSEKCGHYIKAAEHAGIIKSDILSGISSGLSAYV